MLTEVGEQVDLQVSIRKSVEGGEPHEPKLGLGLGHHPGRALCPIEIPLYPLFQYQQQ